MSIRAISVLTAFVASVWLGMSPASAQTNTRVIQTVPGASSLTQVANLTDTFKTQQAADTATPASGPEKRIALVIGNSAYQSVATLLNPSNDGKAVSQFLTTAGFDVIQAVDLTRQQMADVLASFATMITERGPNAVALVYYAGHGLQVDGENFLVPVDAKIEKEDDIPEQTVRLVDVMKILESVKSRLNIVIVDACRNNPFSAVGDIASKGLAIVDAPTGSIVAYSTAPGSEALDGNGRHSPYAAALIRVSKQPGLSIELLFKRVRLLVNEATDGKQVPWESSSLTSDFAFFAIGEAVGKILPAPVKVSRVTELGTRPVTDAYAIAVEEDQVEYYEEFVRLYPTHPLCDRVRTLLTRRLQTVAWHQTVKSNKSSDYENFVSRFGNSDFARAARRLQVQPRKFPVQSFVKINFQNGQFFNRNGNGGNFNGGNFNNGNNGGLPKVGFPGNNGQNNNGQPNNGGVSKVGIPAIPGNNNGLPNNGQPNNGGVKVGIPGNTGIVGNLPNVGNGKPGLPSGQVATLPTNGGIVTKPGTPVTTLPTNGGIVTKPGAPAGPVTTLPQGGVKTAPVTTLPGRVATLPNGSTANARVINGGINPAANGQINRVQIQQAPIVNRVQIQQAPQIQRQVQIQQSVQSAPVQRNNAGPAGNNRLRRVR